jgi:hypothetical protein
MAEQSWQPASCREVQDSAPIGKEYLVRRRDEGTCTPSCHSGKGRLELARIPKFYGPKLDPQQLGGALGLFPNKLVDRIGRAPQNGDARDPWQGLLEQLDLLGAELHVNDAQPRDVVTRSGEASDEARRRSGRRPCDDRDRPRRTHGGLRCLSTTGHDDIDLEPDQLRGEVRKPIALPLGPPVFEDDVLAFPVSQLAQSVSKRVDI